jgi:hypothetical protein
MAHLCPEMFRAESQSKNGDLKNMFIDDVNDDGEAIENIESSSSQDSTPDSTWTLPRLADFAKSQFCESILQAHKSAVALFRAGCALSLARSELKNVHGEWKTWKRAHCLRDTTVNDAIRLYENAKTEEALAGLGITEAKKKFVYPSPKEKRPNISGPKSQTLPYSENELAEEIDLPDVEETMQEQVEEEIEDPIQGQTPITDDDIGQEFEEQDAPENDQKPLVVELTAITHSCTALLKRMDETWPTIEEAIWTEANEALKQLSEVIANRLRQQHEGEDMSDKKEGEDLTALIAEHLDVITFMDNDDYEERGQMDYFDFYAVPIAHGIEVTIHYSPTRRKKLVCDSEEEAAEVLIKIDQKEALKRKKRKHHD